MMQGPKRTIGPGDMVGILLRGENLDSDTAKDNLGGELISFDNLGLLIETYSNGQPTLVYVPWHSVYIMSHLVEDEPSTKAAPKPEANKDHP